MMFSSLPRCVRSLFAIQLPLHFTTPRRPEVATAAQAKWIPLLWACWALLSATSGFAAAPKVLSSTPASGATGVALDAKLVLVFDQAMDTTVSVVPSFPPFQTGNLDIQPFSLSAPIIFQGDWSDDGKTLTLSSPIPLPSNTTITWTINPTGVSSSDAFANASGVAAQKQTGTFKTGTGSGGGTTPTIASVTPVSGATGVPQNTTLVFVFDQAMTTTPAPIQSNAAFLGSFIIQPAGILFSAAWGADGKTLTLTSPTPLPANTQCTWTLNPSGTLLPIKSASGSFLAMVSGNFTTGGSGGGGNPEICEEPNSGFGSFDLSKSLFYTQTSASSVIPRAEFPTDFRASLSAPTGNVSIVSGSVITPSKSTLTISNIFGFFNYNDIRPNESALDTAYPAGGYTFQFTLSGSAENKIPMTIPKTPTAIPQIANWDEAQKVDVTKPFTLKWNATGLSGAHDFLYLSVTDESSGVVFLDPNPCIPRTISPTATSVVIPANTFPKGAALDGLLAFGTSFYLSSNAVPKMVGSGTVTRSTQFTIVTVDGSVTNPPTAARFTQALLLPNGNRQMKLTGSASRTYSIEKTSKLVPPTWTSVGTVTMDASGNGTFEDSTLPRTFPAFYRAVGN